MKSCSDSKGGGERKDVGPERMVNTVMKQDPLCAFLAGVVGTILAFKNWWSGADKR